ncbi:MAG TPA: Hsp20/alpha crystallin family protein [Acidimicrobiales bacterium]|nr:Hsp20/alpha crystallin family protein [Acidimicrobiales bacterium]
MLMRFDPFRELDRLSGQATSASRQMPAVLPMDAYRRGEHFVVHLDLPGTDPSSVELTVERNVLTIKAERSWTRGQEDEVLISERPQGVFTRQLFLGESLDTDAIEANYDQGVLTLTIPVAEQAKPRRVAISSDSNGQTAVEANSTVA